MEYSPPDSRRDVGGFLQLLTAISDGTLAPGEHLTTESELFEARMAIEVAAVSLAADRATPEDLDALRAAARRHGEASGIDELIATDEEFHAALISAAHNSLISRVYAMLVPGLREFRRMSLAIPASARRSLVTHEGIVDAIASGSPSASRVAAAEHLWPLYSNVTQAARAQRSDAAYDDRRVWFLD